MIEAKYKLTEESVVVNGKTLYRIEALKDFGDVKRGDKGGFIENEDNLFQSDNCWVYDNAKVRDNALVFGEAKVYDNAFVCGCTEVYEDAIIYGNAVVCENAVVCGYARVNGDAVVCGYAKACDNANVFNNATVRDNAKVCGKAEVFGHAEICGDAVITSNSDYIVFKNWWSSGRYFTWTRGNDMWRVGCFHGTGKDLIEKAYMDSELSGREYKRVVDYVESILKFP